MFESARLKLARAGGHVRSFAETLQEFVDKRPYNLRCDSRYADCRWFLTLDKEIPEDLMLIAGDAIHNLHSALDHCVWELVVKIDNFGGTQKEKSRIKFPTSGSNRTDFEALLRGMNSVSIDTIDFLISLAVYPGGWGEPLLALHSLDILDKHHVLVPVVPECRVSGLSERCQDWDGSVTVRKLPDSFYRGSYARGRTVPTTFGNHFGVFPVAQYRQGPHNPTLVLDQDHKIAPQLFFAGPRPFADLSILRTLKALELLVGTVIHRFDEFVKGRSPSNAT